MSVVHREDVIQKPELRKFGINENNQTRRIESILDLGKIEYPI